MSEAVSEALARAGGGEDGGSGDGVVTVMVPVVRVVAVVVVARSDACGFILPSGFLPSGVLRWAPHQPAARVAGAGVATR